MRGKRIAQWICVIIVAATLIFGENFIKQAFFTEKTPVTVYAPKKMEAAFNKALSASDLVNCKIVMTDDPSKADICVEYAKENDSRYMQFAFSPFVIGYNTSDSRFKELKNAEIVVPSEYNSKFYEMDFIKVINEVIEEGKWKNLGVKEQNTIRLFYPAENSDYWHDFYNFMLVTVNGGKYPSTEVEMKIAVEHIERFIKSDCTEAVANFYERLNRTDGFSENCLYVMPEALVKQYAYDKGEYVRLFFPLYTTYMNYYVIGNTDNGKSVVNAINKSDSFFSKLKSNDYRSTGYYELGDVYRTVYDERDVYNLIDVPKENFFTGKFTGNSEE